MTSRGPASNSLASSSRLLPTETRLQGLDATRLERDGRLGSTTGWGISCSTASGAGGSGWFGSTGSGSASPGALYTSGPSQPTKASPARPTPARAADAINRLRDIRCISLPIYLEARQLLAEPDCRQAGRGAGREVQQRDVPAPRIDQRE